MLSESRIELSELPLNFSRIGAPYLIGPCFSACMGTVICAVVGWRSRVSECSSAAQTCSPSSALAMYGATSRASYVAGLLGIAQSHLANQLSKYTTETGEYEMESAPPAKRKNAK